MVTYVTITLLRWDVISASVDDRTDEEKGLGESPTGKRYINTLV